MLTILRLLESHPILYSENPGLMIITVMKLLVLKATMKLRGKDCSHQDAVIFLDKHDLEFCNSLVNVQNMEKVDFDFCPSFIADFCGSLFCHSKSILFFFSRG